MTVSRALNRDADPFISEATRRRVRAMALEMGYQPNASARALRSQRTGSVAFILSDAVADGLANIYYAQCLAGVEQVCREREYGLTVGLYNLSNLESFIFPKKVGERAVDGVILADHIVADVLTRFKNFGLPIVCVGDDMEHGVAVPVVVRDYFDQVGVALRHLVKQGHRRVALHIPTRTRALEIGQEQIARAKADPELAGCEVSLLTTDGDPADYRSASQVLGKWLALPEEHRPTALYGGYQVVLAVRKLLARYSLQCPRDLALISGLDTPFCDLTDPGITSVQQDMVGLGRMVCTLLLDHLEKHHRLEARQYVHDTPSTLVVRESCSYRDPQESPR